MDLKFMPWLIGASLLCSCGSSRPLWTPQVSGYEIRIPEVSKINDSTYVGGENFLQKNRQQLWELSSSGNPLQLGYSGGALLRPLLQRQEAAFFSKVEQIVPSKFKQSLLRSVLRWYTRRMPEYVLPEFQAEMYGLSRYSSDHYDFIAPKFQRSMYLHAAHDIGHAMQDLMLVGCSSLAAWNESTEDGRLLLGRVFDFYVGDDFAEQKLVQFVRPERGIPFMSVSWPGMIGVASGMNLEGLTVTINAGKSKVPLSAKTPISLVTREILQYAKTIDEAVALAKKRQVFVSESIMVGSARDSRAVIIEVSPENFGVYEAENSGRLICTNHFQSEKYASDRRNLKQIQESHSHYRYEKIEQFFKINSKVNPEKIAALLRNRSGISAENIGNGNEKAINQLLAHHAVIFSPEKKLAWVSASPYQLGEFVCYDLQKIFSGAQEPHLLATESLNIAEDPFLNSPEFKNYEAYRAADRRIDEAIKNSERLPEEWLDHYIALNPNLWIPYFKAGKYYFQIKNFALAKKYLSGSLKHEISSVPERKNVEKLLRKAQHRSRL